MLVSRPQLAALREAERTSKELRALGVGNQCLIINGIFETHCAEDATSQAMQRHGHEALDAAKEFIGSVPSSIVPLRPINILGLGGLRVLLYGDRESALPTKTGSDWTPPAMESLEALVADIEPFAWVINQSLLNSGSCDPLLQRREEAEHRYLREVVEMHSNRTAWLPWQPEELVGPDALARLAASTLHPALS